MENNRNGSHEQVTCMLDAGTCSVDVDNPGLLPFSLYSPFLPHRAIRRLQQLRHKHRRKIAPRTAPNAFDGQQQFLVNNISCRDAAFVSESELSRCHGPAVPCRFWPSEIWVFHPFPSGQVQNYYTALARRGTRDRVEEALGLPAGSVAESLLQFHDRVRKPVREGTLRFRPLTGGQPAARFCGGRVRVSFLTPVALAQFAYADAVERCTRTILADGPSLRPVEALGAPEHNLTSGAVLVEYGRTRIVLMADAEGSLWQEWLTATPPRDLLRPVDFLKVSHHGSANGYYEPLYAALADRMRTVAVVTPFNHGSIALPSAEGVRSIQGHVRRIYCTNRELARGSTGENRLLAKRHAIGYHGADR
jgi:hypothetical protein